MTLAIPDALLRGFHRVDDPLMVARYCEALEAIGASGTDRHVFHIDAAGYSPEIAADLGDPFYLGQGVPDACALLLCGAQLSAPGAMS